MPDYAHAINQHYGQAELSAKILTALQEAGKDIAALTRDDLASFDEHHGGGRAATRELARLVDYTKACTCWMSAVGLGGQPAPSPRVWLPGHGPISRKHSVVPRKC